MLMCPFRVNQKITPNEYPDWVDKKDNYEIEQYFPECIYEQCPYYFRDDKLDDKCMKALAEYSYVAMSGLFGRKNRRG